jgi:hypothetical protein
MRSLRYLTTRLGIFIVPACVLACSSSTPGQGSGDGGGAEASGPVSFKTDLLPQFERACGLSSACHQEYPVQDPMVQRVFLGCNQSLSVSCSVADPGPLVYPGLMGLSQEDPSMHYVTPNDPTNSYLLRKMENTLSNLTCLPVAMDPIVKNAPSEPQPAQPCGTSMPLGLGTLADLNLLVRAWIMQGARDN